MTFAQASNIDSAVFFNRTQELSDRIGASTVKYYDAQNELVHTFVFPAI